MTAFSKDFRIVLGIFFVFFYHIFSSSMVTTEFNLFVVKTNEGTVFFLFKYLHPENLLETVQLSYR